MYIYIIYIYIYIYIYTHKIIGNQTKPVEINKKFLECIQDSFFTQHVFLHTSGDNILDLVMFNDEGLVENLSVGEPFGTSEHCVIIWDMVIKRFEITVTDLSFIILFWIMHS